MAQLISVKLSRFDGSPWGFRLQGGKDFGTPLIVQKVNGGSPAEAAGLRAGDAVIRVNNVETFNLRHKDAQDVIVRAGNSFEVTVQRGGGTWRPSVSPVGATVPSPQPKASVNNISPVTKTSLAANKKEGPLIGSGHNFTPKPFLNGSSDAAPIKSIVNKQYNSPVGIYSEQTIAETLSAQAEVLAGGVLGVNFKKNEKNYDAGNSEVFKMVQEADKEPKTPEPVSSRTEYYGSISHAIGGRATSPRTPTPLGRAMGYSQPASSASSVTREDIYHEHLRQGQSSRASSTSERRETSDVTICNGCDNPIVGLFVRIKEKNLHVECFKCSTCGTSLKNVGYYNINSKLYCEIHAKLVARQQCSQGYVPVTVPPKAPAGTISAALGNLGNSSPLSPPPPPALNGTSITAPYALQNYNRRPNSDLGNLPRGYIRPAEDPPSNGHSNNGTERETSSEKVYTSTITIRTGNEVGKSEKNPNECLLNNNKNQTNNFIVKRQLPPAMENTDEKSSPIIFNPIISEEHEGKKTVVGIFAKPLCQVTNRNTKSPVFVPSLNKNFHNGNNTLRKLANINGKDKTDFSQTSVTNPQDYSIHLNNHKQKFCEVISTLSNNNRDTDKMNGTVTSFLNQINEKKKRPSGVRNNSKLKFINGNDKCESAESSSDENTKQETNYYRPANFTSSASALAAFLLANRASHPETLSSSPKTPPRLPTPPNSTSSSSSVSSSSSPPPPPPPLPATSRPNHLGTQPIDAPSFRPVQPNSCNLGGPRPFGSSSVAPSSNYSSPANNNPASNNFSRPQSQTVTESYHEECDYYEEINESSRPPTEKTPRPPSSVKGKSLAWPPVKQLEDVTYPTASPIWIDPNPVLHRRPKQNVPEKRLRIQESCSRSQNVSRTSVREEREYERDISCCRSGETMDNSCNQPFYRKECIETRRECRASSTTRSDSAEGIRRSLTPTRINQPTPKPWTATVTSESNSFGHVEAPTPPEPPVCRKVCTCRIVCERTSGPGGPEHEQEHHYHEVICELCNPPPPEEEYEEPEPEEPEEVVCEEVNDEVVDLSKFVPPDVAVCPRGIENQHNMYTETMEKDEGSIHIKKTTIYEKTVELLSPSRAGTPIGDDDTGRRSATSMDREVAGFSGRKQCVDSAEVVSSAIETNRMMEEARREEEERRCIQEEECRREAERIRREEEEIRIREENRLRLIQQEKEEKQRRIEQEKKETDRRCRQEEEERMGKHVSFATRPPGVIQESIRPSEVYERREYVKEERTEGTKTEEHCRQTKKEVQIHESSSNQVEEERRQCLREQVEAHKCIREQRQPERQLTLQERRLTKRFRPQSEEEKRAAQAILEAEAAAESCQRKHVKFEAQCDRTTRAPPQTQVKNSTPKEWRSEMLNALTTAPDRPYSPFESSCSIRQEDTSCGSKSSYSKQIRYQETCRQCPAQKPKPVEPPFQDYGDRPVSPFADALTTAPERPYTPLGGSQNADSVICVKRSRTPTGKTIEGYCHPAEILYTDAKTRQSRSRERKLKKMEGPRPLPTPPPDYKLRDASPSPARSLSSNRADTPNRQGVMAGLKRPGTIPTYQKYLVADQYEAVHEHSFIPSRTPTPNRPKSPAPGPPEPPASYLAARAQFYASAKDPYACERVPPSESCSRPEQKEEYSYHLEEDTPQGHRSQDYIGTCRSYCEDSQQDSQSYCHQEQHYNRKVEERSQSRQSVNFDGTGCGISQISQHQPSLPCPLANVPPSQPIPLPQPVCQQQCEYQSSHSQSAISERVQKTGVKVLPTPPKCQQIQTTQVCESRRVCQTEEEETMSAYNVQKRTQESNCPNTGVTVLPCRASSGSGGTRAGIVIIPCEGQENSACPRSGICVTPTPDRSGLCVSPAAHGRSSASCSGPNKSSRSGGCEIDVGNCPASGIRVGTCSDGSICVGPCKVPGVAPVQCPKPILKPKCPTPKTIPFPQIPLPCQESQPPNPCGSCPLKNQSSCDSFQPIKQQPRTNLSNQLTRMTVKRDKHVVQLFKPQAQSSQQCDDGVHCEPRGPTNTCHDGVHCEPEPFRPPPSQSRPSVAPEPRKIQNLPAPPNLSSQPDLGSGLSGHGRTFAGSSAPKRGRGILNQASSGGRQPLCGHCNGQVRGPFITALGQIWCPDHFVCVNPQCRRQLHDIGFVQEKGQLYCEYCFERFIAPACNKCNNKIKGDSLTAIGKHYHPECFNCTYCGKLFGNSPFFLEEGLPYCEADWNELFTTKCYACGFPVEAGDRWVEALNNNYHSQCFNCTMCKKNLEGQSFYAKGGRPFCKNHAK